jgi:transmembrane sensor
MNLAVREEAAAWLVEFRTESPDPPARARFAEWLRDSPEHVSAYLKLAALWRDAADLGREPDAEALIALARTEEANVVNLERREPSGSPNAAEMAPSTSETEISVSTLVPSSRWQRRLLLAAAASVIALGLTMTAVWLVLSHDTYSTTLGEQRTLALSDGSTVELNALSAIRVRFTDSERRVDLVSGQALFNVTHNAARPFVVVAGVTRVQDVGTEFEVARSESSTIVTVVEGVVSVTAPEGSPRAGGSALHAIEVAAGEQLTIAPQAVTLPHPTNVAAATAWTQQQLFFESTPLSQAAEAFNRFNARRLLVEGDALKDFHVSGTFPARDPASLSRFILFLRDQPGIEVQESDGEILVKPK